MCIECRSGSQVYKGKSHKARFGVSVVRERQMCITDMGRNRGWAESGVLFGNRIRASWVGTEHGWNLGAFLDTVAARFG